MREEKKFLNVRITPHQKLALVIAAAMRHLNITRMIEEILVEYCQRHEIPIEVPKEANGALRLTSTSTKSFFEKFAPGPNRLEENKTISALIEDYRHITEMGWQKTAVVSARLAPEFHIALEACALKESCSVPDVLETMVSWYCRMNRIALPEEHLRATKSNG